MKNVKNIMNEFEWNLITQSDNEQWFYSFIITSSTTISHFQIKLITHIFSLTYNSSFAFWLNIHQSCKINDINIQHLLFQILTLIKLDIIMIFELYKIKNNLMIKESQQRIQSLITTTLIIIMIKCLSNNIKFLMLASLKSFILKTLSLKISHKLSILLRSIHDISCDILIDFVVSKIDKEKNLKKKSTT
jgi:hypothetical protein